MPVVKLPGRPSSSSRSDPYVQPTTPIGDTYRNFNKHNTISQLPPHSRLVLVPGGCDAGDSARNNMAKETIKHFTTPVKYIFFAGGHGRMVDSGTALPTEPQM